ncbi:MAG: Zn-dependent hydrolase [Microgenomates group bacterium GW2011_GWA2_40_6]|nr:MAG: Zn-dependent hydrolase [Microgenomates group bacterium GW2011_GWA2_40_6]
MEIKYLGHSSFLIKTKTTKLVTDPFDSELVGLKFPKTEADIITISHHHKDHDQAKLVQSSTTGNQPPLIIDMPGEFEKMGIRIFGFQSFHDKTKGSERGENILYKFEAEGISVLHCGDLGFIPEDSFIDLIGEVDILLVPVGGFYTINADEAAELVKKIEPAVIIPMHYNHPKLNQKNFGQLTTVNEFTKKFGIENLAPIQKLVYKKEEIEQEMKVVVLEI